MIVKNFILLVLTIFSVHLYAQEVFPNEVWHNGQIITNEDDTLKGKIMYNLESDIVQYQTNKGTVETYTARKVIYFEVFDETVNRNRVFYSLLYDKTGSYETLVIFEVLVKGNLTLLSREKVVPYVPKGGSPKNSTKKMVYDNYVLNESNSITLLSTDKKTFIASMPGYQDRIKKYIKDNKLDVQKRSDLARIIALYNSISN